MDLRLQGWQIERVHTRDELQQQWHRAVSEGLLPPGTRMPNERLISQLSGLSRSTVRAFLAELEHGGRIRRHVGRGTYVADALEIDAAPIVARALRTPAELLEFRLATEPALVELIILKATDAQLEQLSNIARHGREVRDWQDAERSDRAFHQALFDATGNRLFEEIGQMLSSARDSRTWQRLKEGSFSPRKWTDYQREHEAVAAALFDRNTENARSTLKRHLGGVRRNWEL
jgi:DNA-binding FadR family transcriptional regulator